MEDLNNIPDAAGIDDLLDGEDDEMSNLCQQTQGTGSSKAEEEKSMSQQPSAVPPADTPVIQEPSSEAVAMEEDIQPSEDLDMDVEKAGEAVQEPVQAPEQVAIDEGNNTSDEVMEKSTPVEDLQDEFANEISATEQSELPDSDAGQVVDHQNDGSLDKEESNSKDKEVENSKEKEESISEEKKEGISEDVQENSREPDKNQVDLNIVDPLPKEEIKDEVMEEGIWSQTNDCPEVMDEDNEILDEQGSAGNNETVVKTESKPKYTLLDIEENKRRIFSSTAVDMAVMDGKDQSRFLNVCASVAVEGVKQPGPEEIERIRQILDERESREGLKAGLGLKKRSADRMGRMQTSSPQLQLSKAKTLAEKRRKLQEDMIKYGVAAIERMYPRQSRKNSAPSSIKNKTRPKMTPFKTSSTDIENYEEVDAREIIKPWSHHKYIQEPVNNRVVYVHRRDGLVPLATLAKTQTSLSSSSIPSNLSLLVERNKDMGKPSCYVRDMDRLVGIGGSRKRHPSAVKILHVPNFDHERNPLPLFEIDTELASYAASAIRKQKIDIRALKKQRKKVDEVIHKKIDQEGGSLVNKMLLKLELRMTGDVEKIESCKMSCQDQIGGLDSGKEETSVDTVTQESSMETETCDESEEDKVLVIKNAWKNCPSQAFPDELNMDECPPLRGFLEGNIKPILKTPILNSEGMTGWDVCQVPDCFCQEEGSRSTEMTTPLRQGINLGQDKSGKKKIAKDLERVKRALKTLGVNIIEYEDQDSSDKLCPREYCKFGCVCDSIKMKTRPPTHCGKVECMFSCSCSKETINSSSRNSKINISAAVGARIQENSERFLSAEEKKFSTTVVLTGDSDTVLLGGSRGTKRKRKLPSRYLNDEEAVTDRGIKELGKTDREHKLPLPAENPEIFDSDVLKATEEEAKIKLGLLPCSVVMPKVNVPMQTEVWCLYHCRYSCGCKEYSDPLDFAPECGRSRNMAKRSIGGHFITKKKKQIDKRVKVQSSASDGHDQEEEDIIEEQEEHIEELIISDDEFEQVKSPDEKKLDKTEVSVEEGQSCRTAGFELEQSTGLKFTDKHNKGRRSRKQVFHKIVEDNTEGGEDFSVIKLNQAMDTVKKGKNKHITGSTEVNLKPAPRQSFQYVRWDVLKEKFQKGDLNIYFHIRPGKGTNLLFLTAKGQISYIASAINIRTLEGGTHKLPQLVESCLLPLNKEIDKECFAVLESNGFAWMFTSLLTSDPKKSKKIIQTLNQAEKEPPKKQAPPPTQRQVSVNELAIRIDVSQISEKLPIGRSMVTVTKNGKAIMQVKLPTTKSNQYWTLVSVGQNGQPTIQCPDSSLLLKCTILQQAANLASATNTTVRIPITADGQDSSFGVYAVPGLKSHVFVGPFKSLFKTDEVVKLDDDEITQIDNKKEQEEEVKVVEGEEVKKKSPGEKEIKRTLSGGQDEKQEPKRTKQIKIGETPHVMTKGKTEDEDNSEIEILTENPKDATVSQAESLKKETKAEVGAVEEILHFSSGKVVYRKKESSKVYLRADSEHKLIRLNSADKSMTIARVNLNTGKVEFPYPDDKKSGYMVLCNNINLAKAWLREFEAATTINGIKRSHQLPKIISVSGAGGQIKMGSEFQYGTLVQSRQEKEESKLLYDLGHQVLDKLFTKSTTKNQILIKAKATVETLKEEGKQLEKQKQQLMGSRTKLFQQFTNTLEGLPVEKKKVAVVNLRKLINSKPKKQPSAEPEARQLTADQLKTEQPAQTVQPTETIKGPAAISSSVLKTKIISSINSSTPYTDVTGIETLNSDGSINPPITAFELWRSDNQANISSGISWENLNVKVKNEYIRRAEYYEKLHRVQHPGFQNDKELGEVSGVRSVITSNVRRSSTSSNIIRRPSGQQQEVSVIQHKKNLVTAQQQATGQHEINQRTETVNSGSSRISDLRSGEANCDDVLGLALQSSGLTQESWEQEQFRIEQGELLQATTGKSQIVNQQPITSRYVTSVEMNPGSGSRVQDKYIIKDGKMIRQVTEQTPSFYHQGDDDGLQLLGGAAEGLSLQQEQLNAASQVGSQQQARNQTGVTIVRRTKQSNSQRAGLVSGQQLQSSAVQQLQSSAVQQLQQPSSHQRTVIQQQVKSGGRADNQRYVLVKDESMSRQENQLGGGGLRHEDGEVELGGGGGQTVGYTSSSASNAHHQLVLPSADQQMIIGTDSNGQQVLLKSDGTIDSGQHVYFQGEDGQLYQQEQILIQQPDTQIFQEGEGIQYLAQSGSQVVQQSADAMYTHDQGEIYLEPGSGGEGGQVFIDEMGRQVILAESAQGYSGQQPQYIIQNGELVQVLREGENVQ